MAKPERMGAGVVWMSLDWLTEPVELPFPPAVLFRNRSSGRHWAVGVAEKRALKQQTFVLARVWRIKNRIAITEPTGLCIVAEVASMRRDAANVLDAAKPSIDSIAQALRINDRLFRPVVIDMQRGKRDVLHVRLFRAHKENHEQTD